MMKLVIITIAITLAITTACGEAAPRREMPTTTTDHCVVTEVVTPERLNERIVFHRSRNFETQVLSKGFDYTIIATCNK